MSIDRYNSLSYLGCRECNPRKGVPVSDYRDARLQISLDRRSGVSGMIEDWCYLDSRAFPSVGTEKQMDSSVVEL
jgi:hypothetical protein